jgi:DNA-directed RNA polymerase subunit RPC12/RpoP
MYKYLFSEDHNFMVTPSKELTKEKPKFKILPTGEYEGGILCKTCNSEILGKYETDASKTIYATDIPISQAPKVKNYYSKQRQIWSSCENVDYKKFKLFLLSIL